MSFMFRDRKDTEFSYGDTFSLKEKTFKKRIRYYLAYGNIVKSIHNSKEDAERQKKFFIDNKIVRYPELLTIEQYYSYVVDKKEI